MKIIYVHCGWRNSHRSDPRSYEHYWTSSSNKAWKKFEPRTGFEPTADLLKFPFLVSSTTLWMCANVCAVWLKLAPISLALTLLREFFPRELIILWIIRERWLPDRQICGTTQVSAFLVAHRNSFLCPYCSCCLRLPYSLVIISSLSG